MTPIPIRMTGRVLGMLFTNDTKLSGQTAMSITNHLMQALTLPPVWSVCSMGKAICPGRSELDPLPVGIRIIPQQPGVDY